MQQRIHVNITRTLISTHIRTIHKNLANLVKNYHGIIERLHLIAQKQTELQIELYDE